MKREKVYEVINGERSYQDSKWGNTLSSGRPGNGERSIDEFALYISGYSDKLKANASEFGDPIAKLDIVRKVAALYVACMEQHGAVKREGF